MRAVLLAAGRGQRLAPYTNHIPKPMLRLAGRPLLQYILHGLRRCGVSQILLVTGYRGAEISAFFGDGHSEGLELSYVCQPDIPLGTGAAALAAEDFAGAGPFFLGWGDVLAAASDYRRLFQAAKQEPLSARLGLERVEDPHQGAAVHLNGQHISSLVEKPPIGSAGTPWNQAGLGIFTADIFLSLKKLALSPRGELEFTGAVQGLIDTGFQVGWTPLQKPRLHLTRPADIAAVEKRLYHDAEYALNLA
jgi:dTDP-glucose pyrophosphorylase